MVLGALVDGVHFFTGDVNAVARYLCNQYLNEQLPASRVGGPTRVTSTYGSTGGWSRGCRTIVDWVSRTPMGPARRAHEHGVSTCPASRRLRTAITSNAAFARLEIAGDLRR